MIEARAGIPIKDIFSLHGEGVFREWERRIVEETDAADQDGDCDWGVVLPAQGTNLVSLKTHALVVCLWASAEDRF